MVKSFIMRLKIALSFLEDIAAKLSLENILNKGFFEKLVKAYFDC